MITDARCHTENTINVIFVSGGKDSLAQWLVAIEENVPILPVFADTGHEHPQTMKYLDYLEKRLGPIKRVRADFPAGLNQSASLSRPNGLICWLTIVECRKKKRTSASVVRWKFSNQRVSRFLICVCGRGVSHQPKPDFAHLN